MGATQQREVIFIIGQTGTGKSYYARDLARSHSRVLIAGAGFDDYEPIARAASFEELLQKLSQCNVFGSITPFRIVYDFTPREKYLAFDVAAECGDCLLIVEEAHRFDFTDDALSEAIMAGRHYGVGLCFISPRMVDASTDARSQITKIIAFRQLLPDDVDRLAQFIGEAAYETAKFGGPPDDPPHQYLTWTPRDGVKIIVPSR